ncbi:MAG TPA: GAF domain-containing SpoIIE family protein phosphatase [Tepidisphaeraceae bacterium]|nr:GAF domain-containing SpoIIE family protein phosphatase [Tepidisphaeraceae bacterium]
MSGPRSTISAEKMREILEVSRLLAVTADLDKLLSEIARAGAALLTAERASIFLHDRVTDQLWTKVAMGASEIRVPSTAGIVGSVFQAGALLNIPDAYADARFNRDVDKRTGFVTRNLLTAPMFDLKGRAIGVIQAVNKTGGIFTAEDEESIALLCAQGGVAIQRYHLQNEAIQVVELRREMDLAKGIQESLLPARPPELEGLEAVGWTLPASVTGGDTYDLWENSNGQLAVFLGDAAGHGLAPALEVLQARTLARALSDLNCDPRWILTQVNTRLAKDLKLGHFVTVFLGCLACDGKLTWSSAGHGPVLYRASPDEPVKVLEPPAPPIGVEDVFAADQTTPVQLEPGGMLVVMSDGIFEAMVPGNSHEMFGVERVIEILDANRYESPAVLLKLFREAVRSWQGRDEPNDDQSIVIVKRR